MAAVITEYGDVREYGWGPLPWPECVTTYDLDPTTGTDNYPDSTGLQRGVGFPIVW